MEKKEVNKILDKMVKNKKIDSWELKEHEYWTVPLIRKNKARIFLCKIWAKNGQTNISTVYNCKNEKDVLKYINYAIDNIEFANENYIWDIGQLQEFKRRG